MQKEVLIIIPAYNEEKNISKVLDRLEQPEIAEFADILVMNDASSDNTNWIVKARHHAVVTHVFNLGYGSALQLGYKYAIRCNYRYVIQMDADGQHDAGNLINLYRALKTPDENGAYPDIVLGSRYLNDSPYFETSALPIQYNLLPVSTHDQAHHRPNTCWLSHPIRLHTFAAFLYWLCAPPAL